MKQDRRHEPRGLTLHHAVRGSAARTVCGKSIPERALYEPIEPRAGPTCTTCMNVVWMEVKA